MSRRSIDQLALRCDDDPKHSAHVARLAVALFDGLAPVHGLDDTAREYLEAGALLANVGLVVAHTKHHLHAYYVIRNSELAGLTDAEIEVIAQIARYHRKSEPKPSHAEFAALSAADQQLVRTLAGILRVAIGLDRSHRADVRGVEVELSPGVPSCWSRPSPARRSASSSTPPTSAEHCSSRCSVDRCCSGRADAAAQAVVGVAPEPGDPLVGGAPVVAVVGAGVAGVTGAGCVADGGA